MLCHFIQSTGSCDVVYDIPDWSSGAMPIIVMASAVDLNSTASSTPGTATRPLDKNL